MDQEVSIKPLSQEFLTSLASIPHDRQDMVKIADLVPRASLRYSILTTASYKPLAMRPRVNDVGHVSIRPLENGKQELS